MTTPLREEEVFTNMRSAWGHVVRAWTAQCPFGHTATAAGKPCVKQGHTTAFWPKDTTVRGRMVNIEAGCVSTHLPKTQHVFFQRSDYELGLAQSLMLSFPPQCGDVNSSFSIRPLQQRASNRFISEAKLAKADHQLFDDWPF